MADNEESTTFAGDSSATQLVNATVVKVPVAKIEAAMQVDIHCRVITCDSAILPGVVAEEMCVALIGQVPVFNRSELREALSSAARSGEAGIEITFAQAKTKPSKLTTSALASLNKSPSNTDTKAPKKAVAFAEKPDKKGDDADFDLESCDSGEEQNDLIVDRLRRRGGTNNSKSASEGGEAEPQDPDMVIVNAAQRVKPGSCVIILTPGLNPAMYVEAAAKDNAVSVMFISAADRLRTKVRLQEFTSILSRGMRSAVWILIESATKSISGLQALVNAIEEVRSDNSFHPKNRIFLMCEPHPHFPPELLKDSITLRFRQNLQASDEAAAQQLEETMHDSKSRIDVLQGLKPSNKKEKDELLISFKPERRRVMINNDVDVVLIEPTDVQGPAGDTPLRGKELDPKETGLRLDSQHVACRSGESLISLAKMSDNRFAVGNNTGQLLMLDLNALPMMQFRPLKACIWDMDFATSYDFAVACEDGNSSIMNYDIRSREITTKASAKFESDVFAVAYVSDSPESAVVSGGLSNSVCVLHSDRQQATRCQTTTSIQAVSRTHNGNVLLGGGSGVTCVLDPTTTTIVRSVQKHQKKVPAACCVPNLGVTGSFDKAVRLWDMRDRFASTHSLVMADVVTAVAIDEYDMCCCSGNSLYVWDIRKLKTVLDSRVNAWKGLTRGLAIFSKEKSIATASVDGVVRVWKYD